MKLTNSAKLLLLVASTGVCAGDQRIQKSDLPALVQQAADKQSAGAVVTGYQRGMENGKLEYEVQLQVEGHTRDLTMDAQGHLLEIEEEVAVSALSPSVLHGLSAQARRGNLVKVESITKQGEIVAYEAQVKTGGKHSEIQVGPNGQRLSHKE